MVRGIEMRLLWQKLECLQNLCARWKTTKQIDKARGQDGTQPTSQW